MEVLLGIGRVERGRHGCRTSVRTAIPGFPRALVEPPPLVILDGNPGLCRAVRDTWLASELQCCTKHKLENLLAKAPKHCHAELKRDYHAITHAASASWTDSTATDRLSSGSEQGR